MTKIRQLFRVKITNELFSIVSQAFGYTGLLQCDYMFCKADLERINTLEKVQELKDELCQYYIPCKAKLYLTNLDVNKCITIFRQILKLFNILLISKQKYIKHKKTTFYSIKHELNEHIDIHGMHVNNEPLVLIFS